MFVVYYNFLFVLFKIEAALFLHLFFVLLLLKNELIRNVSS